MIDALFHQLAPDRGLEGRRLSCGPGYQGFAPDQGKIVGGRKRFGKIFPLPLALVALVAPDCGGVSSRFQRGAASMLTALPTHRRKALLIIPNRPCPLLQSIL